MKTTILLLLCLNIVYTANDCKTSGETNYVTGCTACDSNDVTVCSTCDTGYVTTPASGSECTPCPTDCDTCTSNTACTTCASGKLLSVAKDSCGDACGSGEMANTASTPVCIADCSKLSTACTATQYCAENAGKTEGECKACGANKIPNTKQTGCIDDCSGLPTTCTDSQVCVPNANDDAGECVDDDCKAVVPTLNCATCGTGADLKKCASCATGFDYDDTAKTCTASSTSTVTSDDRKNATVPAAAGNCDAAAEACLTCDETTTTECKTCADGYKLDDTAKTCKDTCADNYAMNASSACVDCPACATTGEVCSVEADGGTKCAAPAAESSGLLLSAIALISAIVLA